MGNRVVSLGDSLAPGPFHLRDNLGTKALINVFEYPRHRQDEDTLADITNNISFITSGEGVKFRSKGGPYKTPEDPRRQKGGGCAPHHIMTL